MIRIEFKTNGEGIDNAKNYQKKHGGRVVELERRLFDSWWLENVYWYSHEYTPTMIDNDTFRNFTRRLSIDRIH